MTKYTQKELKNLVAIGAAVNLTNESAEKIPARYDKIGYSCGIYGINGGLIRDTDTGALYAITARNSMLARIF
jgi:hypothetical protein|nr:MAG TPA: hypothetical protein [Caudoviricetes sp.]